LFSRKVISLTWMVGGRVKAKVEFSDEEPAQIAELVSEYFDVYCHAPKSPSDKVLQSIYRKSRAKKGLARANVSPSV
jgi:hypothetical protein